MPQVFQSIVDAVSGSNWSYLIVFAIAMIDAFFPLVPSEATAIAAGVVAGTGGLRVEFVILAADGRLRTIPTKHSKLLVVLDRLAQEFEPGQSYPEAEVNEILRHFHPDYAALRRYLVENGFMTREENVYWRSGGTFYV